MSLHGFRCSATRRLISFHSRSAASPRRACSSAEVVSVLRPTTSDARGAAFCSRLISVRVGATPRVPERPLPPNSARLDESTHYLAGMQAFVELLAENIGKVRPAPLRATRWIGQHWTFSMKSRLLRGRRPEG